MNVIKIIKKSKKKSTEFVLLTFCIISHYLLSSLLLFVMCADPLTIQFFLRKFSEAFPNESE